jgi:hypothetical protein
MPDHSSRRQAMTEELTADARQAEYERASNEIGWRQADLSFEETMQLIAAGREELQEEIVEPKGTGAFLVEATIGAAHRAYGHADSDYDDVSLYDDEQTLHHVLALGWARLHRTEG